METLTRQSAQNKLVSLHYDRSEKWNKELYVDQSHFFNRLLIRRKEYAFKLLDRVMPCLQGSAIDLGCGPGAYLEEFKHRGFDVYGIDISQEMLNVCKDRLGLDTITFQNNFTCGNIEETKFINNSFDVAACIGVFGLLLSDDKTVVEINRILKPGGILLLAVENMMSLSNLDFVIRQKIKSLIYKGSTQSNFMHGSKPKYSGLTLSSNYFPNQLGLFYKIYNPYKLVGYMKDFGFTLADFLTVGHEFRILRRLNFIPHIIDNIELRLEKLFWDHHFPYFSISGQFFIGAFIKM